MKTCPKCKIEKELKDFGNNKNTKDGKQRYCKKCQAEFDHNHYLNNIKKHNIRRKKYKQKSSQWLKNYKQTCECKKCGDKRWYVLDFHHIDPLQKDNNVSNLMNKSIKSTKKEIEKCIVLCSNCHREFHHLEKVEDIKIKEYIA